MGKRHAQAFWWTGAVVAAVVFGALAFLYYGFMAPAIQLGQMTTSLSRCRMLHLATQMMTLDGVKAGKGMSWTSHYVKDEPYVPATLAEYCDALLRGKYLTPRDLRYILSAPGIDPGLGTPDADHIGFRIFVIDDESPSDQPFLVTANWHDRRLTDQKPFGLQGFVMFAKGGSGGIYKREQDAGSTNIFPESGMDGRTFSYETVK